MNDYPDYRREEIETELKSILPPDRISVSLPERINNALGIHMPKLDMEKLPYAVVRPSSDEEVSALLKYANHKKIPVFVRGSGTSLSGASTYRHKGIVLNTSKLNRFNMVKENGYVELGAGLRAQFVQEQLAKEGYFFPMHPGSIIVATIGGITCNNTSAHVVDPCKGKPRDYILGLRAVLATGEIIETGTKSLRRPAGLDLTQLFMGGDGVFGVITEIRMRLDPDLKKAYGVAFFKDGIEAVKSVQRLYQEKFAPPLFLEYLDKRSAEAGFRVQGLEPPLGPLILFQFIGQTEKEAATCRDEFFTITQQEGAVNVEAIEDTKRWEKFWLARSSVGPYAAQWEGGRIISAEVVSTLSRIVECYQDALKMAEDMPTLQKTSGIYLYGHLGALSLHPSFIIPAQWSDEDKLKLVKELFSKEAEINTKYETCGGEWGQTAMRIPFYLKRYGPKSFEIVRGMKKVVDPNNIINPDVLPD